MAKQLLHSSDARRALARGVARLASAVEPTLGPKGMNAMIDRPIGTPMITRDGVSIASEIELTDRFENMGAQVVREVSMQTNDVAGDGTTTAIVLANGLIQGGVELLEKGAKAVDVCRGIEQATEAAVEALQKTARPAKDDAMIASVAEIAAGSKKLGAIVAAAFQGVGEKGVITTDFGVTTETTVEVLEGMSFDRGYISHHMVTDQEKMVAELKRPLIVMTDLKIKDPASLDTVRRIADEEGRSLLIIAEEISPEVVVTLLGENAPGKYLVVHPPEYGQWRKSMMEDLAILTGGRVIARDLGGRLETATRADLGAAAAAWATASDTAIIRGEGDPARIEARRSQVQRQLDIAPPNIEQDKLRDRLAKLSGGTAVIYAGGTTPVEQKRTIQLIEDSLAAVRAAAADGVVAGGGTALLGIVPHIRALEEGAETDVAAGMGLVASVLSRPLARIALNAGQDPNTAVAEVSRINSGHGFNARAGRFENLFEAGVIDPVRVTAAALANAASVATLILTTETLVGDLAEGEADPTAGAALGGGAELLGRS
ncbi:MAG: chaperonin GroEL [Pseudomonadota bacterium]